MHVQLGGALEANAQLAGWIVGLSHLQHVWNFYCGLNVLIGMVTSGISHAACWHSSLVLGSKKMMYGWMSSWTDLWKHGNKA